MLTIQADIWHQIKGRTKLPTITIKNHADVFKVIIRISLSGVWITTEKNNN